MAIRPLGQPGHLLKPWGRKALKVTRQLVWSVHVVKLAHPGHSQKPLVPKLTKVIQPREKPGREEPWAPKPRLVPQQAERPVKLPQQGY
jgi:hypothetical protein